MFAQGDTAEDEADQPLEGDDPDPTPINSKLIILAVFAIIFAVVYFRKRKYAIS